MKGLTEEEFQKQWIDKKGFFTDEPSELLRVVARKILTKEEIDSVLLCILQHIEEYKRSPARQRFKPRPNLRSKAENLRKAQRELQAELAMPVEFHPSEQEIEGALESDEKARKQNTPRNLDLVTSFLHSGKYNDNEFVTALATLDQYPQTKPTLYVETFFTCVLAEHFRRKIGTPDFPFIEQIIRGCFGGKKVSSATLRQRCHQFESAYPMWRQVAEKIYAGCENFRATL